jgi:hypothetical protein
MPPTPRSLWQLGIVELTGHNLEAHGREEVNRLLHEGWHLLHIYTLKYREGDVWRERPMAILGRSRERKEKRPGSGTEPAVPAAWEKPARRARRVAKRIVDISGSPF